MISDYFLYIYHMNINYSDEFPVLNKYLFLDHAAVSPIPKRSVKAGYQYLNELNQKGHIDSSEWITMREKVKKMLSNLLKCSSDEVAFIKNTSEGILIVANSLEWREGDNIILFSNEFPSNVYPWINLEKKGVEIRFVPENDGQFLLKDIKALIDEKTRLLAVSFVEFTTGFKNDLKSIGKLCQEHDIIYVVDAIQGLGAIPIDVKDCHIDFLSAGGHKWLMSGMGIGCFYANLSSISKLKDHNFGFGGVGDHSDFLNYHLPPKATAERFEDGMFNLGGIYVLMSSLKLLLEVSIEQIYNHIINLTDYLIEQLTNKGYKLLTPVEKEYRSGIISFYSEKQDSTKIHQLLTEQNIIVSNRRNCIRVSPHFYNTKDHLDHMLKLLPTG